MNMEDGEGFLKPTTEKKHRLTGFESARRFLLLIALNVIYPNVFFRPIFFGHFQQ